MTRSPVCPACGSTAVTPDTTNGGAGRNVCHCGHRAAVRDFYPNPVDGELVMDHGMSADGQSVVYRATMFIDPRKVMPNGELNDMRQFMQQPIPDPEGYRTDKHTGNLRPAKPFELQRNERPPAPIRQYKDD